MSRSTSTRRATTKKPTRGQTEGPRRPPAASAEPQHPRHASDVHRLPTHKTDGGGGQPMSEHLTRKWDDTPEFFTALARFVNETTTRPVTEMLNEFQKLNALPAAEPSREFQQNPDSNRYQNIVCAEQTRVRLSNGRYIHANWIRAFGVNRFICTQGPLPTTCDDFWTMIVQENIGAIVMLCDVIEQQRIKCHQYWPTELEPIARFVGGQITVKFIKEEKVEGALYRTNLAIIAPQMRSNYMQLQHYHWRQWPDHGVPQSDLAPLRLLFHVQRIPRMVVHCSAGIGRTGTLVAVYLAFQTLQLGQRLNMFMLLRDLRQQRAQSVQTVDQFLYIYFVLLRYAFNKAPKLNISTAALEALIQTLNNNMKRG